MRSLARDTAVAALVFLMFSVPPLLQGATVEYDLTIARQAVNITGKPAEGMTISGVSPGPTLRFREGDLARIRVHNRMEWKQRNNNPYLTPSPESNISGTRMLRDLENSGNG